ncbi:hypothetical protein [Pseudoalteromonas sp. TAB23]|uniref:hypothetical protein n=1 Tax=Pseudoalteromonas sp. TAB23 TaxID=1938595 RepID=UPI00040338B7|nr:hypothetical protein [Pseudoalteromonas sp. TAB23]
MSNFSELFFTLVALTLAILIIAIPILVDVAKQNWKKRFREQIKAGIINSSLTYEDMLHIAERWSQDRKAILLCLRILHSDAISGDNEKLSGSFELLRKLISQHQTNEPYAELPENIGLQLSNIKQELREERSNSITQLAASLSVLYSSNIQELSKQKKLTFWGFIVGMLGFIVGVGSLYASFKGV